MTLRTRLTVAFLAVVLGPIIVGGLAVGAVATFNARDRENADLQNARVAINETVSTLCQRARAAAEALAATVVAVKNPQQATQSIFSRGLADALRLEGSNGALVVAQGVPSDNGQRADWGDCLKGQLGNRPIISAGVELQQERGSTIGWARAGFHVDPALARELAGVGNVGLSIRLPDGKQLAEREPSGDTRSIVVQPRGGQPLHMVLAVPRANLFRLYVLMAIVTIAVALLSVVAAHWLARTLTRPLAELSTAADDVAGGDLSARVPVRGYDEIGRLGATFNRMIRDMQAYVGALTASRDQLRGSLIRLGDALSSSHDATGIAEITLETAMAATGARAGLVLLTQTDEYPPRLVGRCVGGTLAGVDPGSISIPVGEGLVGQVAARGLPRKGRASEGAPFAEGEPRGSTYIAVPFSRRRPGQPVRGVLALYDRLTVGAQADDFDDADVQALRNFAAQAAAALERVRSDRTY